MKTAAQAAERWKNGAATGQQAWQDGIASTTVDVTARAIAQSNAAVQGYTASITSGAWARSLTASGGTANWKLQSQKKAANYGVGVAAGAEKYGQFIQKFMPAVEGVVSSLPARGPAGSQQNKARVIALIDALHARKGEFKS